MSCRHSHPKNPKKTKLELRPGTADQAVSRAELEVLRQKVADLARQKPEKAAVILSDWINRAVTRKKAG